MKKIFISYVFEDNASVASVQNWKNQGLSKNIEFITESIDIRHKGEKDIKKYLGSLIDESHAIVILIGDNTHCRPWVEWEYNYAQNKNKKIAVFRIPNTTGGPFKLLGKIDPVKLTLANLVKAIDAWGWPK